LRNSKLKQFDANGMRVSDMSETQPQSIQVCNPAARENSRAMVFSGCS